jgi:hypothetical protein
MQKAIFFYHESNPHVGRLSNTQYLLYERFHLVGPVKHSWSTILLKCHELVDLINSHLPRSLSIGELAAMLEQLTKHDGLSTCKYKATVTENKLQFRRNQMNAEELIVLEVIAQFAGCSDYEIVSW